MADHDGFFSQSLDDGTRIKLGALGWFLSPWCAKLATWDRRGGEANLWYVDGFAGPGRYSPSGELGSPLIAATHALRLLRRESGRRARLSIYCVEDVRENFDILEREIAPFRDDGITIVSKFGRFADHVADIARVTAGTPVLGFIDPWGFTGFELAAIAPLLRRQAPIDLILRLHHQSIHRLRAERANLISSTVGSDRWDVGWESKSPEERVQSTLSTMRDSYMSVGRFMDFQRYPVKLSLASSPDYTLGFTSRRIDAFRLWNNKLGSIEHELFMRESPEAKGQATLFGVGPAANRVEQIGKSVLAHFRDFPCNSWQEAYDWLIFNCPIRLMETELTSAISSLIKAKRLESCPGAPTAIRKGRYRVSTGT